METWRGNLLIAVTLVITALVWVTATPVEHTTGLELARQTVGALMLTALWLVFMLSTRNRVVIRWFGGLRTSYRYHKWLALCAIGALLVHALLAELTAPDNLLGGGIDAGQIQELTGEELTPTLLFAYGSAILFATMALITLFSKKLTKLKYEAWRWTHRLMFIAFCFGVVHAYLSSSFDLFAFTPVAIWTGFVTVAGVLAGVYIIAFYRGTAFDHTGDVTAVAHLGENTVELTARLSEPLPFVPGQFAFVRIHQAGIESAPHPFSIAGGDGQSIVFAIKDSGDFTGELNEKLEAGARIAVDGPYGGLDFDSGRDRQVWIAGGIGITPFISRVRADIATHTIECYYSYDGSANAVYSAVLADFAATHQGFRVHPVDTTQREVLTVADLDLSGNPTVYMCGPAGMMKVFATGLKERGVDDLRYEGFALR